MRRLIIAVCILLPTFCGAQIKAAESPYVSLADKLAAGETEIDYDTLRTSCVDDDLCKEISREERKALMALLQQAKYEEALQRAERALEGNRAHLLTNMVAYAAASQLGQKAMHLARE